MPTYEYVCETCGHEFERFQSIKADPVKLCPQCGAEQAKRKISVGAGFIFKGGGFYETDYRSEGYKKAAEADKAPAAAAAGDAKPADAPKSAESKPAAAAEAKPAAKPEPKPAAPSSPPSSSDA